MTQKEDISISIFTTLPLISFNYIQLSDIEEMQDVGCSTGCETRKEYEKKKFFLTPE